MINLHESYVAKLGFEPVTQLCYGAQLLDLRGPDTLGTASTILFSFYKGDNFSNIVLFIIFLQLKMRI